ncbi:MAG: hypothetical protein N2246_10405, partial [Candidatus Sumerlaeia bacterium]|nr:hypothetical protein [Candidatus Sumerlaeia bacterium]
MTRRERVIAAVQHKETDFVPYQVEFTHPAYQKLIDYTGDPNFGEKIGNHIAGAGYGGSKEIKPGYFQDIFGVVWNRTVDKDIGIVEEYHLKSRSLSGYAGFPDPHDPRRYERLPAFIEAHRNRFRIVNLGFSLWERAWT